MKKKLLSMALAAAMVLGSAVPALASDSAVRDDLVIALDGDVGTLAPNGNAGGISALLWCLYDHLWYRDNDGNFNYMLATEHEMIDDTHIAVTIRDDVYDTNGVHFTASDALFSLKVATSGNGSYTGSVRYLDLENSEVVDDTHFILALNQPNVLQLVMIQNINMVTEESYNNSPDGMVTTPVGTGPFKLEEAVMGSSYTMVANEDYWNGAPLLKKITFKTITESSQRINALQTGEIDATFVAVPDVASALEVPGTKQFVCTVADTTGILFNCDQSRVTSNVELRKAIACAIDAEAIRTVAFNGQGVIPTQFLNPGLSDYEEGWIDEGLKYDNYYAYDVEKAKEHLAASGVPEGTEITVLMNNSEIQTKISQVIQAQLADIGLVVNIQVQDAATFNDTLDTNPELFDIAVIGYSSSTGAGLGLANLWVGQVNYHHWDWTEEKAQLKELISQALVEQDEAKRIDLMRQIGSIINDQLPMYSLYFSTYNYVVNENLEMAVKKDFILDFTKIHWVA